jgi:hypothetical protein
MILSLTGLHEGLYDTQRCGPATFDAEVENSLPIGTNTREFGTKSGSGRRHSAVYLPVRALTVGLPEVLDVVTNKSADKRLR